MNTDNKTRAVSVSTSVYPWFNFDHLLLFTGFKINQI